MHDLAFYASELQLELHLILLIQELGPSFEAKTSLLFFFLPLTSMILDKSYTYQNLSFLVHFFFFFFKKSFCKSKNLFYKNFVHLALESQRLLGCSLSFWGDRLKFKASQGKVMGNGFQKVQYSLQRGSTEGILPCVNSPQEA